MLLARPFCAARHFALVLEFTQDQYFAGFSAIYHPSSSHLIHMWRAQSISVMFVHSDIKLRSELSVGEKNI